MSDASNSPASGSSSPAPGNTTPLHVEKPGKKTPGWVPLFVCLGTIPLAAFLIIAGAANAIYPGPLFIMLGIALRST